VLEPAWSQEFSRPPVSLEPPRRGAQITPRTTSMPLLACRAPCPVRWAGPHGHHPDDRREVRSASSFSAVLPQAPRLHPARTCRGSVPRRPISATAPRTPSCTAPSRAILRPSWPGPLTKAAATDSPPSSPVNSAPTCAVAASSTGACMSGASSAAMIWSWPSAARAVASAPRAGAVA